MATTVHLTADADRGLPPGLRGAVLVIGNFDGVHRGHQALIAAAEADADPLGAPTVAVTFEPHPRSILRPDATLFRLTPEPVKLRVLSALGIDGVAVIAFDRVLASLGPEAFLATLVGWTAPRAIVVGADFRFGRGRAGDTAFLEAEGSRLGFRLHSIDKVSDGNGVAFSSGRVRESLAAGDIAAANGVLGYRWFVIGDVIRGDRRGRELGYPTANISLPGATGLRYGIYAVTVALPGGPPLPAVASYGRRPTFGGGEPLLEVHLFDFAGDLYGQTLTVTLLTFLRGEETFDSVAALVTQMDEDSRQARAIIAAAGTGTPLDRALASRS